MTLDQLINAYVSVHDGVAPDTATQARLQYFMNLSANYPADPQAMSYIINSADNSTAVAVLSYQFFTGKSPTKAGIDYLVNSAANTKDLNDAYYAGFNLENRFINFAANLGVQGEGASFFATKYGAMSYSAFVSSIYETIIGSAAAKAVGIDPTAAIADVISRQAAILATATSTGMINANMTAAQVDIALKAATAGYLLGEAIKADVGVYATAADNFMVAMALGTATYNTDITTTYANPVGQVGAGAGSAVAPNFHFPAPVVTPPSHQDVVHNFVLTTGDDVFTGESLNDTFTGVFGIAGTINFNDVLNGGGGDDTLVLTNNFSGLVGFDRTKILNIEHLQATATAGPFTLFLSEIPFVDVQNVGSIRNMIFQDAAAFTNLSISNTTFSTTFTVSPNNLGGGADALTVTLADVTSAASVIVQTSAGGSNLYETINLVSKGTANSVILGTDNLQTSLTKINISGSANLTLAFAGGGDHINTSVTTIDAHTLTGGLTVTGAATIANTIIGGSGADVITLGAQGVNAVSGADVITTNGGADVVRFVGNTAAGTGGATSLAAFATITDFDIAHDKLAFSANDSDFVLSTAGGATTVSGLAKGAVAQALAGSDAMVVQSLAANNVAAAVANVSFIKLTQAWGFDTDIKTTFLDALGGGGQITGLSANGNYLVSMYDTTHSAMIVAVVNTGGDTDGDTTFSHFDLTDRSIAVVGVVSMTSGDYAAFGASHLGLAF